MTNPEIINVCAILASPVIAVIITLWHQGRKEKRERKIHTFFSLAAYRDSMPIHPSFVVALNTIDIVFHDCPKILAAWRKYHENLNSENSPQVLTDRLSLKLDLLFELAQELGYKTWKQTDMQKYYTPISHYDQSVLNADIQKELLAYLKKSNRFYDNLESSGAYVKIEPKEQAIESRTNA